MVFERFYSFVGKLQLSFSYFWEKEEFTKQIYKKFVLVNILDKTFSIRYNTSIRIIM